MDIAALIFAPLLLALIYSRTRIGKLPRLALVGLPVGLMAILFVALMGYAPAIQESVVTKTPLIRDFGGRIFPVYLDGLGLLFGLLITGLGAMIALYVGKDVEGGKAYQRFVCKVLWVIGIMLGLVLIDHAISFFAVWMLMIIASFLLMREKGSKKAWIGFALAALGGIALLMGFQVLSEVATQVKMLEEPVYALSQISTSNLSRHEGYDIYLTLVVIAALTGGLQNFFVQRTDEAGLVPTGITFLSGIYLLARLYPALHDNPLWWSVVTGVGLLIMLIGSVWALRQRETKAILVYRSLSALGACVALLGLPEFLGYKVALIGIMAHALSGAALFLSLDISRQRARWGIVGLALLSLAIFHVLMIAAFYRVTLAWGGIALAVVIVSTALWVVSAIKIMRDETGRPTGSPLQSRRPIVDIVAGILALGALASVALFDAVIVPLLNPIVLSKGVAGDTTTPLILGIVALIGGGVLYATYGKEPHSQPLLPS